jgi:hypothetical protein
MHQAIGLSAGPNWAPSSSSPHGLRYAASPSVSIAFYVLRMARSYGFIESASILLNGKRPSFVTSVPSHDLTLAREISPRTPNGMSELQQSTDTEALLDRRFNNLAPSR